MMEELMQYTESQMIEAKKRSFNDGHAHSRPSKETLYLLNEQMNQFKKILEETIQRHEIKEKKTGEDLKAYIHSVANLVKDHIEQTELSDKTMRDLITGSKVARAWFFGFVSIVAGIGVLVTAAIAVKEGLKR